MNTDGRFYNSEEPITTVHRNLDQDIIEITEDRLRLILTDYVALVEKGREWIAPLGIFLAIVIAFVTSDFHDAFYLKAAEWKAVFLVSGAACVYLLIRAARTATSCPDLNDIIRDVKRGSRSRDQAVSPDQNS